MAKRLTESGAPKSPTEMPVTVHLHHPNGGDLELTGPAEWATATLEQLLVALAVVTPPCP